jgi:hypothetical protein
MNFSKISSLAAVSAVLLAAAAYNVISALSVSAVAQHAELISSLPRSFPGYQVEERKIAETESIQRKVDEQLNFSEAVFREYRSGSRVLQVYAARWAPKKMHPRLISGHVPDICWRSAGWTMRNPDYVYQVPVAEMDLPHAQYRLFESNGTKMHVLYWHVVDGRLSGYAEGINSRSRRFLQNLVDGIAEGSGEQFFIRLSSPQPWTEWRGDPLFERVIRTFAPVLTKPNS